MYIIIIIIIKPWTYRGPWFKQSVGIIAMDERQQTPAHPEAFCVCASDRLALVVVVVVVVVVAVAVALLVFAWFKPWTYIGPWFKQSLGLIAMDQRQQAGAHCSVLPRLSI